MRNGANVVYDPMFPDINIPEMVRQATNGRGADVVFECAGIQAALDMAVSAVRPRGMIVNVALWGKPASVSLDRLMVKEAYITSESIGLPHSQKPKVF